LGAIIMSIQCGILSFKSDVDHDKFTELLSIASAAGDKLHAHVGQKICMGFGSFATTPESELETQPFRTASGAIVTWDGRLDNREDLNAQLRLLLEDEPSDVAIVGAAYDRWGVDSLPRLIGDFALSIWDPQEQHLLLATDLMAVKPLFYTLTSECIIWSTTLEGLLNSLRLPLDLDEEYIAGSLILSPPADRTPYRGIRPVPAGTVVKIRDGSSTVRRYWDFDPGKRTVYRDDAQYDEHFREVFGNAVRRRLRSNKPVLAELSGGMDSTSIVCMADRLIEAGAASVPRLDTISYFDDREPNWDERQYFELIEARRKQRGVHLDVGGGFTFEPPRDPDYFPALPPGLDESGVAFERKRRAIMRQRDNRVLLSGIGGDEFLGGVPNPIPELADLLYAREFAHLFQSLKVWSLSRRQPLMHLLGATVADFMPATLRSLSRQGRIPKWLARDFVKRHRDVFVALTCRTDIRGPLPSFQTNHGAVQVIRRQLAALSPYHADTEVRYPYLDRDLLEFLFAIPRQQLVRPGRRRALMRRALVGIVPMEILERRRKAFVVRAPMAALAGSWKQITSLTDRMIAEELGLLHRAQFLHSLESARQGREEPVVLILNTLRLELWLRNALVRGIVADTRVRTIHTGTIPCSATQKTAELTLVGGTHEVLRSDLIKSRQVVLENHGGLGSSAGYEADE
jgi:asparagine synthase (glutamine-hydrolysing)